MDMKIAIRDFLSCWLSLCERFVFNFAGCIPFCLDQFSMKCISRVTLGKRKRHHNLNHGFIRVITLPLTVRCRTPGPKDYHFVRGFFHQILPFVTVLGGFHISDLPPFGYGFWGHFEAGESSVSMVASVIP